MPVRAVCYSADGRFLYSASDDHSVNVYEADSGTLVTTLAGHTGWVLDVASSADGATIASCGADGKVNIWDAKQRSLAHTFEGHHEGQVCAVAFGGGGGKLVSAGDDGALQVMEVGVRR